MQFAYNAKRLSTWMLANTVFAALIYLWMAHNQNWASNIVWFYTWAMLLLVSGGALIARQCLAGNFKKTVESEAAVSKLADGGSVKSVPKWVDVMYDICLVTFIVAYGHFGFVILYCTFLLSQEMMTELCQQLKAKVAVEAQMNDLKSKIGI